jgi:hypothetical protein
MRCIILGGKIKSAEKKAIHHQSKKQDMPTRRLVNPSSIPKKQKNKNRTSQKEGQRIHHQTKSLIPVAFSNSCPWAIT